MSKPEDNRLKQFNSALSATEIQTCVTTLNCPHAQRMNLIHDIGCEQQLSNKPYPPNCPKSDLENNQRDYN